MQLPSVLQPRGFRLLLYGQAVSSLGDWMATFALMALTLDLTDSPAAVGGILVLRLIPSAFAGPVAAKFAAGRDRKQVMLQMDLARAVLIALVPLISAVWWVYLLALLTEIGNLVFLPARDATVPDLVQSEDDLPTANSLVLVSSYGNIPVGAAVFALVAFLTRNILPGHPQAVALWADSGTYLVSYFFIRQLPHLGSGDIDVAGGELSRFRDAFRPPIVRQVMPAACTVFVGVGALFTLGIPFVQDVLEASNVEFGWLVALFGVGGVVGLASSRRYTDMHSLGPIRLSVAVLGSVLALMSLSTWLWIAYVGAVLFGASATFALVGATSFLQANLSGRERMLGFTAFHVLLRIFMSVAAIGAGLASDRIGRVVDIPGLPPLKPPAMVLFVAGAVVLVGAALLNPGPIRHTEEGPAVGGDDHHGQRGVDPTRADSGA